LKISEDEKDCFLVTSGRKYFQKFIDTIEIPEKFNFLEILDEIKGDENKSSDNIELITSKI
jgi:hypothetical protein